MKEDIRMLKGKSIIVTGTTRGMGKEMLTTFAENGANIFAHARKETDEHRNYCKTLEEKNNVIIKPVYFDLNDESQIKEGIKKIKQGDLCVDGLVNNAGISYTALVQMTSIDKMRELLQVNFIAPYILCQYVTKLMARNGGGSIVNISSSAAIDCNPGLSAYGSSKAALLCLTRSLAAEVGEKNIRVNAICPGVTETDMISEMTDKTYQIQKQASFLKKTAMPKDIANTAMMLLSDLSTYITGQVISVDGGVTQYDKR